MSRAWTGVRSWWRRHHVSWWLAVVAVASAVGVVGAIVLDQQETLDEQAAALERARERGAEREAAIELLAGDQDALRRQLLSLGEVPAVPPRGEPGPEGPPGPLCPEGYSADSVVMVALGGRVQAQLCTADDT